MRGLAKSSDEPSTTHGDRLVDPSSVSSADTFSRKGRRVL
jgi:hypothetical protein